MCITEFEGIFCLVTEFYLELNFDCTILTHDWDLLLPISIGQHFQEFPVFTCIHLPISSDQLQCLLWRKAILKHDAAVIMCHHRDGVLRLLKCSFLHHNALFMCPKSWILFSSDLREPSFTLSLMVIALKHNPALNLFLSISLNHMLCSFFP